MSGEKDLLVLLASLAPSFIPGKYVFCTFPDAKYGDHTRLKPIAACIESEGLTLVIPQSLADKHGIIYASVFVGITLGVHSSLNAVGLTAVVSTALAKHGISANMIAGYYHDHVFVPALQAGTAMEVIESLSSS